MAPRLEPRRDSSGQWIDDPNAPDDGPRVVHVVWGLFALSTIFLLLRLFCKLKKLRYFRLDDWFLIAAWACELAHTICVTVVVSVGFGKHPQNINPIFFPKIGLFGYIIGTLIILAASWSKTSFAISLFSISGRRTKIALVFIIVSMNLFMTASALVQFVQCSPVSKSWDYSVQGTCWSPQVNIWVAITSTCYSALMDIVLALLPWTIIVHLQMNKKEKIGIALAMSVGIFACVSAVVKCVKMTLIDSSDYTYSLGELIIWTQAEVTTTIIASSIPVLRTLLREVSGTKKPANSYFQSTSQDEMNKNSGIYRTGVNMITVEASGREFPSRPSEGEEDRIVKTDGVQVAYDRSKSESEGRASEAEEMEEMEEMGREVYHQHAP